MDCQYEKNLLFTWKSKWKTVKDPIRWKKHLFGVTMTNRGDGMDSYDALDTLCDLAEDASQGEALVPLLVQVRDINAVGMDGKTPLLHAATRNPAASVFKTLIEAGSKVDYAILCAAIVHNPNPESAKLAYAELAPLPCELLDKAFLLAVASNTDDVLVRFFVEEGANVHAMLPMDIYPHCDENRFDMDDFDGECDDAVWVDDEDPVMQNAIVVAIYENPEPADMVALLISLGVRTDVVDDEGYSVVMHALDNLDVLKVLMRSGVDFNATDLGGQTALMYACEGENAEAALELIKAGAEVNRVSVAGENALHYALCCHMKDNLDVVRALIEAGVDVNYPDPDGFTPLHLARMNYAGEAVVKLLEDAGAVLGGPEFP